MNKREKGSKYEALAVDYIKNKGYKILELNYRCKQGEIDIIAQDGKYIVFIEVKYRASASYGSAANAVFFRKQQNISRVAAFYLLRRNMTEDTPCRFDVIAIDGNMIHHYENAFDYCW